jgi:polyisoprenoid-binding protein YceI
LPVSFLGSLILPAAALLAAGARWLLQGRGNVYTDPATSYYVRDRDIGWRLVENGPVSIGLDVIAVLVAYALAFAVALLVLRWWERRRGRPLPAVRTLRWVVAALPVLVPIWAFASGSMPEGASERAPEGVVEAPAGSISGELPGLPAGVYRVVPHAGTRIVARLSGGGEKFEARFVREIEGTWRAAPGDLRQPMSAEVSVATEVVDTGIELRSKHAREDYLIAAKFPRIRFRLDRLLGAQQAEEGIAYRAAGTVELMGMRHPVTVTGLLQGYDAEGRRRLGFAPTDPVMRASAKFEIRIRDTKLAPDAGDFDGDIIPIEVSLVLRRQADATTTKE